MRGNAFKKFLLASAGVAVLGIGTTAGPVTAQTASADADDFGIEEIVVTSRRRSELLRDVPATVTAFTTQTLRDAGVKRVEDFIALTPGVSIVNAAEVGDTQVNIRGINGARDAENSFAFIIDGVLMTNPAAFNREFTDLAQIEILKGPQGAIYGRNAAAGAIIITTEKPGDEFEGHVTVTGANNASYYVTGSVGGAVVENQVYAKVSFDYRTTDGFYENTFVGRDDVVDQFKNYNINGRLIFVPNNQLTVDVKGRYGEVNASAIVFNADFALPAFAAAFGAPAANEDVNEHEFVFQNNILSDNDQTSLEFSAKFDYEMEAATLTGWFLFSDIDNDFIADGTSGAFGFFASDPACQASTAALFDGGAGAFTVLPPPQFLGTSPTPVLVAAPPFDAEGVPQGSFFGPYSPTTCDGIQEQIREQRDISFEFRLASRDDQRLRWLGGIYFLDIDRRVGISLNRDSGQTPIRGLFQRAEDSPNFTEALLFDQFDSTVFAVFGELAYDATDTFEIALALRYDHESRKVTNLVPTDVVTQFVDFAFDGPGGSPLNPGLDPFINPAGISDQKRTFEEIEPKVSLSWDATDQITLFGSWGVGFKAGGFNNQGSQATINVFINTFGIAGFLADPAGGPDRPLVAVEDQFEKETSSAFEVGFKSRFLDGRVTAEAAFYYVKVNDMQAFEFFVGPFGLLRVVTNIDDVDIKGIEFAANARVTDYLSLYGGFNFIDSEIKAFAARPDTVGNKSPYTPDYTINLGTQLDFPVFAGLSLVARADVQFIGPTWFHAVQDQTRPTILSPLFEFFFGPQIGIPAGAGGLGEADFTLHQRNAYHTINLRVGLQGEAWAITFFAQNLTNEVYLEEVIPAPEFGGSFIHPGRRRTWGVEVTGRF